MTRAARPTALSLVPHRTRHVADSRHRTTARHEWLLWTVSLLVRFYAHEDGGPKTAVVFAFLFLAFAVAMGVVR